MAAPAIRVTTTLRVNRSRGTLRDRLGGWLRRCASRIDGRVSLALEIDTSPRIGPFGVACVVRSGVEHMQRGLRDMAVAEAEEMLMRRVCPELYAAEPAASRRRA